MSLVRATATIGGLTLVSRVLGFLRDMLMARYVGAGFASDAFLIAFRLPNLFRALFAEGAFASAFVPMFNRIVGKDRDDMSAGLSFAEDVLSVLLPVLLLFTAVMMVLAGPVVWAMTGGFHEGSPQKFDLAVEFTRITFPYLMLISLVSLLGGILNSIGRFAVNAAAPILLNLSLIAALLFFHGPDDIDTARVQSIAVTVSGILQFLWLMHNCGRNGVGLKLRRPRLTPAVKRLLKIMLPAVLGAGATQFNLLISTTIAARYLPQGSVSYLYYADRLNQLPLGLIGIGVGTALLPALSRALGGGREDEAAETQNRAVELVLLLTLPATAALMVSATPMIRALLQHGAFSPVDTFATATALAAFALGLPAYVLIKVLTPGFYARSDTRTPVRFALVAMAVNLAGNLLLMWPLAHIGLALSTAVSAWVNVLLLYGSLRRRGHFRADQRLKARALRYFGATLAMTAALLLLNPIVDRLAGRSLLERIVGLLLMGGVAAFVYFGVAWAMGAFSPGDLKRQLSRRRA